MLTHYPDPLHSGKALCGAETRYDNWTTVAVEVTCQDCIATLGEMLFATGAPRAIYRTIRRAVRRRSGASSFTSPSGRRARRTSTDGSGDPPTG